MALRRPVLTCLFLLLLAGCSESPTGVSGQAHQVEEVLERPRLINNEPKHLVEVLDRLIDELEEQPDSSKMIEAWGIAIELATYDGPRAEVFASMEAYASGDTGYDPVKDNRVLNPRNGPRMGKTTPCEDECLEDYTLELSDHRENAYGGPLVCGACAIAAALYSGGTLYYRH